ncbi:MAG: hypothetical protein Ta2E_08060 [Mycoplasmoidaceae bacterium]|nr:MAG: hypothetical protein Ta2E_08060 [Mycoplasmoidaceae bacterium]
MAIQVKQKNKTSVIKKVSKPVVENTSQGKKVTQKTTIIKKTTFEINAGLSQKSKKPSASSSLKNKNTSKKPSTSKTKNTKKLSSTKSTKSSTTIASKNKNASKKPSAHKTKNTKKLSSTKSTKSSTTIASKNKKTVKKIITLKNNPKKKVSNDSKILNVSGMKIIKTGMIDRKKQKTSKKWCPENAPIKFPSPKLAPIIGKEKMTNFTAMKKIWHYIKLHDLQDLNEKKNIHADELLKVLFNGKEQVTMFDLAAIINKNLSYDKWEEVEVNKIETNKTHTTKINKTTRISNAPLKYPTYPLAMIVGKGTISNFEATKTVWNYIKRKNLQDELDKQTIHTDPLLKALCNGKTTITMFEISTIINENLLTTEPKDDIINKKFVPKVLKPMFGDKKEIVLSELSSLVNQNLTKEQLKAASIKSRSNYGGNLPLKYPSPALSRVTGKGAMTNFLAIKIVWKYIHAHNLQDENDGTLVHSDPILAPLFENKDPVTIFEIPKFVNANMRNEFEDDDKNAGKDIGDGGDDNDATQAKKRMGELNAPLKYPSPFLATMTGPDVLTNFTAMKKVWMYINSNDLKDNENKRMINCDHILSPLCEDRPTVTMFELSYFVARNLADTPWEEITKYELAVVPYPTSMHILGNDELTRPSVSEFYCIDQYPEDTLPIVGEIWEIIGALPKDLEFDYDTHVISGRIKGPAKGNFGIRVTLPELNLQNTLIVNYNVPAPAEIVQYVPQAPAPIVPYVEPASMIYGKDLIDRTPVQEEEGNAEDVYYVFFDYKNHYLHIRASDLDTYQRCIDMEKPTLFHASREFDHTYWETYSNLTALAKEIGMSEHKIFKDGKGNFVGPITLRQIKSIPDNYQLDRELTRLKNIRIAKQPK